VSSLAHVAAPLPTNAKSYLAWIHHVRGMHALQEQKPNKFWTSHVTANVGNPKKLWHSLNSVLMSDSSSVLDSQHLNADKLAKYIMDKVKGIHADTENVPPPACGKCYCFSSAKSHALDPLPTFMLYEVVDIILPYIWVMCNASLQQGYLPASQKKAIVTPVTKKTNTNSDNPKNYRPISNLTFLS